MTPLEIVVRGHARRHYPAERGTVSLSAAMEGSERKSVYRDAVRVHESLTGEIAGLADAGAVTRWNSDQLRVYGYRPYDEGRKRSLRYQARIQVEAEFVDFERLSAFLDDWAAVKGIEVGHISWDVTEDNRTSYEAELRRAAVADATLKAQAYAEAAGRAEPVAVQLADQGMLQSGRADYADGVMAAPMALGRAAPAVASLELRPDEITINIAVDAKFVAL